MDKVMDIKKFFFCTQKLFREREGILKKCKKKIKTSSRPRVSYQEKDLILNSYLWTVYIMVIRYLPKYL